MNRRIYIFWFALLLANPCAISQQVDTLPAIEMRSRLPVNIAASATGLQEMNKKELEQSNSLSVADAAKYFSGVLVKDYGGIGGLKTISVRSLGANHTGVMYDGMIMGDARAGLIDLGRLSTENLEYIRLYQSHAAGLLLPARSFSSASLLVMATPSAREEKQNKSWFSYRHGSFGFINPSAGMAKSLNKHASLFVNANYQKTNGRYSFDAYEGGAKSRRSNTAVQQWRVEIDLPVMFADSSRLKSKIYYYQSRRELPGSVLLYNESANESLENTHVFVQTAWYKTLSPKWNLLLGARSLFDRQVYYDPDFLNNEGYLENDFRQTENYVNAAVSYIIGKDLNFSYSSDYFVNKLSRNDPFDAGFAEPVRKNFLNNIAITYTNKRYELNANLLHTYQHNYTVTADSGKYFRKATPAASFSIQLFEKITLRLRASYKEIFRAPSLDDMYFTFVGNTNLRPEFVKQASVGLTLQTFEEKGIFRHLLFTADGNIINVKDKILALPRNNLFQWSMMNVGKARTKSIDLALESGIRYREQNINTIITYSYQDARDVSSPSGPAYNRQLAYIPGHSGSARISSEIKKINISWNMLFTSNRYRTGDRISENRLEGYAIHDLHLSYVYPVREHWTYKFSVEMNNLFNKQYEVVKYFPMPGFNWRIGLTIENKK